MASKKDAIKKQMAEFVQDSLQPDEAIRGGVLAQSGPMPGLFGLIGMLFIKQYYVLLTSGRVLFVRTSQFSGKPLGVEFDDSRDTARIEPGVEGRFWGLATYVGSLKVKLRYHKGWAEEMNVIRNALGGGS